MFYSQKEALTNEINLLSRQNDHLQSEVELIRQKLQNKENELDDAKTHLESMTRKLNSSQTMEKLIKVTSKTELKILTEQLGMLESEGPEIIRHEITKVKSKYKAKNNQLKKTCDRKLESLKDRYETELKKIKELVALEKELLLKIICEKERQNLLAETNNENLVQTILKDQEQRSSRFVEEKNQVLKASTIAFKQKKKELNEKFKKEIEILKVMAKDETQRSLKAIEESHIKDMQKLKDLHKQDMQRQEQENKRQEISLKCDQNQQIKELKSVIAELKRESAETEKSKSETILSRDREIQKLQETLDVQISKNFDLKVIAKCLDAQIIELKKRHEAKVQQTKIERNEEIEKEFNKKMEDKQALIERLLKQTEQIKETNQKNLENLESQYQSLKLKYSIACEKLSEQISQPLENDKIKDEMRYKDEIIRRLERDLDECRRIIRNNEIDLKLIFESPLNSSTSKSKKSLSPIKLQTPRLVKSRKSPRRNPSPAKPVS